MIIYLILKAHIQINSCLLNKVVIQGNYIRMQTILRINCILRPIYMMIYYYFLLPFCSAGLISHWISLPVHQRINGHQDWTVPNHRIILWQGDAVLCCWSQWCSKASPTIVGTTLSLLRNYLCLFFSCSGWCRNGEDRRESDIQGPEMKMKIYQRTTPDRSQLISFVYDCVVLHFLCLWFSFLCQSFYCDFIQKIWFFWNYEDFNKLGISV